MMATESPSEGKYALRCAARLGEEMESIVHSCSCEPVGSIFLVGHMYFDSEHTHSRYHFSFAAGDTDRDDHAIAVIRVPMWKDAMRTQAVFVYHVQEIEFVDG